MGGHAIETWTHPKSNAFWLRDFLPLQIPDARIMTFGYNAAPAFGPSTSEVIDHAKSLLASLVDKREEPEVPIDPTLQSTMQMLTISQEEDRPLVFIAHSLGEIVLKQVGWAQNASEETIIADECYRR
jgi:hypothetical protein